MIHFCISYLVYIFKKWLRFTGWFQDLIIDDCNMWYEIHWAVFILFALSFGCMFVYLTSCTNLWVEPGGQGSDIFYHWNIGQRLSEGFLCNSNSVSIQEVNQSMNVWMDGSQGLGAGWGKKGEKFGM